MTRTEAEELMKKGVKIKHRYFTQDEWMTIKGDIILLEDGVECNYYEFWDIRSGFCWDDGYSIFEEPITNCELK